MAYIHGEGQGQGTLFPVMLDDLLPVDHVCRVIDAFVHRAVSRLKRTWKHGDVVELSLPFKTAVSRWYNRSVAVERGPPVFSYDPGESWVKLRDHGPTARTGKCFRRHRGTTRLIQTKGQQPEFRSQNLQSNNAPSQTSAPVSGCMCRPGVWTLGGRRTASRPLLLPALWRATARQR